MEPKVQHEAESPSTLSRRDDPAARRPRKATGRWVALAIGVPVSLLLLWLAARGVRLSVVRATLADVQPAYICLALLMLTLMYVLQAERWKRLARHEGSPPLRFMLELVIEAVALNNVLPGRPGEFLRGYRLARKLKVPFGRAFATVIVDRASDVVALAILLGVVIPFIPHPRWLMALSLAVLTLCLMVVAGVLLLARYRPTTDRAKRSLRMGRRLVTQLREMGRAAARIANVRDLATAIGISALAWLAWAVAAWAVAASIDISLTPREAICATALINLGVAIPSSPGFIGTYQWLATASLGLFGVPSSDAFAFSVLMHALWYIPTTLVGMVLLIRLTGSLRPWRSVEALDAA